MFVFYDTETTGILRHFSQIVQIGLIVTDDDLNIIATKEFRCRPSPWVLVSPGATLTTGFGAADLAAQPRTAFEMLKDVDGWLNALGGPLKFAGYNNVDYDNPILAQGLYESQMDPQLLTRETSADKGRNGCIDIITFVKAVQLFMPGTLKLEILNYYKQPSLTLTNVAQQNGVSLSEEEAHDAMNDIKATLGIAKLLKKAAPQIWDHMLQISTAAGVDSFLKDNDVFTHVVVSNFGKTTTMIPTAALVERAGSATQVFYDLRVDPAPYLAMSVDQLKDVLLMQKSEGEKPFSLVRKANQPFVMPLDISAAALGENADVALFNQRADLLKTDQAFLDRLGAAAVLAKQEKLEALPATPLPEYTLERKISPAAETTLKVWQKEFVEAATWGKRASLVKNFAGRFESELKEDPSLSRFADMAERLVYEHAPQELDAARQSALKTMVANRMVDPDLKAPYMSVPKALDELEKIRRARDKPDSAKWQKVTDEQLSALKRYYEALGAEHAPFADAKPAAPTPPEAKAEDTPAAKKRPASKKGPKPAP